MSNKVNPYAPAKRPKPPITNTAMLLAQLEATEVIVSSMLFLLGFSEEGPREGEDNEVRELLNNYTSEANKLRGMIMVHTRN